MSPIETAVTETLASAGIRYRAVLIGPTVRDGWQCDAWRVRFERLADPAVGFDLDYFTGTGHRKMPPHPAGAPFRPGTLAHEQWAARGTPVAPHPTGVLASVVLDDTRGADFDSWCADLGMSTDSRKALAIYEQCQRQTRAAREFFGPTVFARIAEILEDY